MTRLHFCDVTMRPSSAAHPQDNRELTTIERLVTFSDVSACYSPETDVHITYTIGPRVGATSRDWIGIFYSDWRDTSQPLTFVWAPIGFRSKAGPDTMEATFSAKYIKPLRHLEHSYQFLYVNEDNKIIGASNTFQVKADQHHHPEPAGSTSQHKLDGSQSFNKMDNKISLSLMMLSSGDDDDDADDKCCDDNDWDVPEYDKADCSSSSSSFSDISEVIIFTASPVTQSLSTSPSMHTFNQQVHDETKLCRKETVKHNSTIGYPRVAAANDLKTSNTKQMHARWLGFSSQAKPKNKDPVTLEELRDLQVQEHFCVSTDGVNVEKMEEENEKEESDSKGCSVLIDVIDREKKESPRIEEMLETLFPASLSLFDKFRFVDMDTDSEQEDCSKMLQGQESCLNSKIQVISEGAPRHKIQVISEGPSSHKIQVINEGPSSDKIEVIAEKSSPVTETWQGPSKKGSKRKNKVKKKRNKKQTKLPSCSNNGGTSSLKKSERESGDSGCEVRDSGCEVRESGCEVRESGCEVRESGCEVRESGCEVTESGFSVDKNRPGPELVVVSSQHRINNYLVEKIVNSEMIKNNYKKINKKPCCDTEEPANPDINSHVIVKPCCDTKEPANLNCDTKKPANLNCDTKEPANLNINSLILVIPPAQTSHTPTHEDNFVEQSTKVLEERSQICDQAAVRMNSLASGDQGEEAPAWSGGEVEKKVRASRRKNYILRYQEKQAKRNMKMCSKNMCKLALMLDEITHVEQTRHVKPRFLHNNVDRARHDQINSHILQDTSKQGFLALPSVAGHRNKISRPAGGSIKAATGDSSVVMDDDSSDEDCEISVKARSPVRNEMFSSSCKLSTLKQEQSALFDPTSMSLDITDTERAPLDKSELTTSIERQTLDKAGLIRREEPSSSASASSVGKCDDLFSRDIKTVTKSKPAECAEIYSAVRPTSYASVVKLSKYEHPSWEHLYGASNCVDISNNEDVINDKSDMWMQTSNLSRIIDNPAGCANSQAELHDNQTQEMLVPAGCASPQDNQTLIKQLQTDLKTWKELQNKLMKERLFCASTHNERCQVELVCDSSQSERFQVKGDSSQSERFQVKGDSSQSERCKEKNASSQSKRFQIKPETYLNQNKLVTNWSKHPDPISQYLDTCVKLSDRPRNVESCEKPAGHPQKIQSCEKPAGHPQKIQSCEQPAGHPQKIQSCEKPGDEVNDETPKSCKLSLSWPLPPIINKSFWFGPWVRQNSVVEQNVGDWAEGPARMDTTCLPTCTDSGRYYSREIPSLSSVLVSTPLIMNVLEEMSISPKGGTSSSDGHKISSRECSLRCSQADNVKLRQQADNVELRQQADNVELRHQLEVLRSQLDEMKMGTDFNKTQPQQGDTTACKLQLRLARNRRISAIKSAGEVRTLLKATTEISNLRSKVKNSELQIKELETKIILLKETLRANRRNKAKLMKVSVNHEEESTAESSQDVHPQVKSRARTFNWCLYGAHDHPQNRTYTNQEKMTLYDHNDKVCDSEDLVSDGVTEMPSCLRSEQPEPSPRGMTREQLDTSYPYGLWRSGNPQQYATCDSNSPYLYDYLRAPVCNTSHLSRNKAVFSGYPVSLNSSACPCLDTSITSTHPGPLSSCTSRLALRGHVHGTRSQQFGPLYDTRPSRQAQAPHFHLAPLTRHPHCQHSHPRPHWQHAQQEGPAIVLPQFSFLHCPRYECEQNERQQETCYLRSGYLPCLGNSLCTSPSVHQPLSCNNSRNKSRESSVSPSYQQLDSPHNQRPDSPHNQMSSADLGRSHTRLKSPLQVCSTVFHCSSPSKLTHDTSCRILHRSGDVHSPRNAPGRAQSQPWTSSPKRSQPYVNTRSVQIQPWTSSPKKSQLWHSTPMCNNQRLPKVLRDSQRGDCASDFHSQAFGSVHGAKPRAVVPPWCVAADKSLSVSSNMSAFASEATICPESNLGPRREVKRKQTYGSVPVKWADSLCFNEMEPWADVRSSNFNLPLNKSSSGSSQAPHLHFQACFLQHLLTKDGLQGKQQEPGSGPTSTKSKYPKSPHSVPPSELPYPPLSPFHQSSSTQLKRLDTFAPFQSGPEHSGSQLFGQSVCEISPRHAFVNDYHQLTRQPDSHSRDRPGSYSQQEHNRNSNCVTNNQGPSIEFSAQAQGMMKADGVPKKAGSRYDKRSKKGGLLCESRPTKGGPTSESGPSCQRHKNPRQIEAIKACHVQN